MKRPATRPGPHGRSARTRADAVATRAPSAAPTHRDATRALPGPRARDAAAAGRPRRARASCSAATGSSAAWARAASASSGWPGTSTWSARWPSRSIPREGEDERVEREARAAARLNHPGIVRALRAGLRRARRLPRLRARSGPNPSRADARGRALRPRRGADRRRRSATRSTHAHAQGVIHRDVKPQNVMVVAEPAAGAGFAKLADFGVAHVASGDPLTRTGDVVGTLAYMAPEQAEGARVDPGARRLLARADALRGLDRREPRQGARRPPPPRAGSAARCRSLADERRDLPLELVRRDRRRARARPARCGPRRRAAPRAAPRRARALATRAAWSSRRRSRAWA